MSFKYFGKLNYTLANEDTSFEYGILPDSLQHVVSVAGSGARMLPLIAKGPRKLTCIDLAQEQLYLAQLRVESVRTFDWDDFLAFWGYPPRVSGADERRRLFGQLKLSTAAREYFTSVFNEKDWGPILYDGKWEKTFCKLSKLNRLMTGKKGLGIFETRNLDEQLDYFQTRFPKLAFQSVLYLLGNASVFNALLYKGHFPKKNVNASYFRFYWDAFSRLFRLTPARENFFLQLCFFGELRYPEGNPIECSEKVFHQIKKNLVDGQTQIEYRKGNVVEEMSRLEGVDFLSFSDVPSYFSSRLEKDYLRQIQPSLSSGGQVVVRSYLRVPEGTDLRGYECVTARYQNSIDREKTQVYQIDVYEKAH